MDDLQFQELLQGVGLSWKGYRKVRGGVKKRVGRHMRHLGCRNVLEYLLALDKNDEEKIIFEHTFGDCLQNLSQYNKTPLLMIPKGNGKFHIKQKGRLHINENNG